MPRPATQGDRGDSVDESGGSEDLHEQAVHGGMPNGEVNEAQNSVESLDVLKSSAS